MRGEELSPCLCVMTPQPAYMLSLSGARAAHRSTFYMITSHFFRVNYAHTRHSTVRVTHVATPPPRKSRDFRFLSALLARHLSNDAMG